MTDIMIDLTKGGNGKRYKIHRCHYCDHDKYPNGKIIDPTTDRHAKQMEDGSWKCTSCLLEGAQELIKLNRGLGRR